MWNLVHTIIITISTINAVMTQENGTSELNYELVKPSNFLTPLNTVDPITTNRGTLGCALFCFKQETDGCTGFTFVSESKICVALAGNIEGELGGTSLPGGVVYRRKSAFMTTPETTIATTTPSPPPTTTTTPSPPPTTTTTPSPPPPTTSTPSPPPTTTTTPSPPPPTTSTTSPPPTTTTTALVTTTTTPLTTIPHETTTTTEVSPCAGYALITLSETYCVIVGYKNHYPADIKQMCDDDYDAGVVAYATNALKIADYKILLEDYIFHTPPFLNYIMYVGIRRRTTNGPWLYDYDDRELAASSPLWEVGYPLNHFQKDCVLSAKYGLLLYNDYCDQTGYAVCEIVL